MKEKKFYKVSPHLPVNDVKETVQWYKENLGFTDEWYYGDPNTDGGCRRDELRILFGRHSGPLHSPNELSLLFFVSNIEAVYQEMLERKLEIVSPLQTYDYGMKEFAIRDNNGYYIRLSESV